MLDTTCYDIKCPDPYLNDEMITSYLPTNSERQIFRDWYERNRNFLYEIFGAKIYLSEKMMNILMKTYMMGLFVSRDGKWCSCRPTVDRNGDIELKVNMYKDDIEQFDITKVAIETHI